VRDLRKSQQLSQEALGHLVEMDRTYVGGIERGEKNPTFEVLRRLCGGLGVSSSELLARAEAREHD
jgi:transcriptional regulator with XRE-family HTH domain